MDEAPLQTECIVSGLLSFVLYTSRVVVLAPLKGKSLLGGWAIQTSLIFCLYSTITVLIFVALALTALTADLIIDTKTSYKTKNKTNRILWMAEVAIVAIVILAAAFTGPNRMRYLIDGMAQLNKVYIKLERYNISTLSHEVLNWTIVLFSIIFGCITVFLDYYFFILKEIEINGNVLISSFYVFYSIMCMQLHILVIQLTVIILSVVPAFRHINSCLKGLLMEINNNSSIIVSKDSKTNKRIYPTIVCNRSRLKTSKRVIQVMPVNIGVKKTFAALPGLVDLYCSLCDIIRQLDNSNGVILVLLLLSFFIHLIITPYNLINEIFGRDHQSHHGGLTLQCVTFVYHFMKLAMVVEPCHQIYEQMEVTKELINEMKRCTASDNTSLITKLKHFSQHLSLNKVTYSPMQLFTLDRSLILAMMGSITTYLVVAIRT